jgi:hypothetical protein
MGPSFGIPSTSGFRRPRRFRVNFLWRIFYRIVNRKEYNVQNKKNGEAQKEGIFF